MILSLKLKSLRTGAYTCQTQKVRVPLIVSFANSFFAFFKVSSWQWVNSSCFPPWAFEFFSDLWTLPIFSQSWSSVFAELGGRRGGGGGMGETRHRQVTNQYWNRFADHCTIFSKKYQIFGRLLFSLLFPWNAAVVTYVFLWRKLARKNANVYVCTGPLYLPRLESDGNLYVKYKVIGKNNVAVPTHFFKVSTYLIHSDWFDINEICWTKNIGCWAICFRYFRGW